MDWRTGDGRYNRTEDQTLRTFQSQKETLLSPDSVFDFFFRSGYPRGMLLKPRVEFITLSKFHVVTKVIYTHVIMMDDVWSHNIVRSRLVVETIIS